MAVGMDANIAMGCGKHTKTMTHGLTLVLEKN